MQQPGDGWPLRRAATREQSFGRCAGRKSGGWLDIEPGRFWCAMGLSRQPNAHSRQSRCERPINNERQIIDQFGTTDPFPITARLPRASKMPEVRSHNPVGEVAKVRQKNANQRRAQSAALWEDSSELP